MAIARWVGRETNRRQVEKHFEITLADDDLTFARQTDRIVAEARLDAPIADHPEVQRPSAGGFEPFVADAVAEPKDTLTGLKGLLRVIPSDHSSTLRWALGRYTGAVMCPPSRRLRG